MENLQLGAAIGELELRRSGRGKRKISGRFPYGKVAVLSDGGRTGRPHKEVFAPRAFAFRVNDPKAEIHLLVGHSYDRPLASVQTGGLVLRDTPEALIFDAEISPALEDSPSFADLWAALMAGLIAGLSPGFRLPPERVVRRELAEALEEEAIDPAKGMHGAIIRRVLQALLFEISLVTVPAYKETEVEARAGLILPERPAPLSHLKRWRP